MKQVTAQELKRIDPHRFDKEYKAWLGYCLDYEWWDHVEQCFTDEMASKGVRVDRISFRASYSQGDYAAFVGRVDVMKWMAIEKYDSEQTYAEAFPALYLAVVQDGTYVLVTEGHRRHVHLEMSSDVLYCLPDGIFEHLDEEAWDELVEEQQVEADLESNIRSWVDNQCSELLHELQREQDHLTSEETFIESCECNDVTFELEIEDEIHC